MVLDAIVVGGLASGISLASCNELLGIDHLVAIDSELVVVPKVMSLVEVMHPGGRIISVEVSR